jgi:hypothetical protein
MDIAPADALARAEQAINDLGETSRLRCCAALRRRPTLG